MNQKFCYNASFNLGSIEVWTSELYKNKESIFQELENTKVEIAEQISKFGMLYINEGKILDMLDKAVLGLRQNEKYREEENDLDFFILKHQILNKNKNLTMALNNLQIKQVEDVLKNNLRGKFQNYKPEPASMPFHTRLLGKDRMALFSFIHSLNTNFGTSIFEPVALALASTTFKQAKTQATAGSQISEAAQRVIQDIMDDLTAAHSTPNKETEIEAIRKVAQSGKMKTIKPTKVDIWLEGNDNQLYFFDIKTAKPNKGGFKEFKRTLLEWTACVLAENPKVKINTLIAIPYNPYEPKPYSRWTMAGMLDLQSELKVASEFWDFLGGVGTYIQLLDIFERVGIELHPEIDNYFARYNRF